MIMQRGHCVIVLSRRRLCGSTAWRCREGFMLQKVGELLAVDLDLFCVRIMTLLGSLNFIDTPDRNNIEDTTTHL